MMTSTISTPTPAAIQTHEGKPFLLDLAEDLAISMVDRVGWTSILPLPLVMAGGSTFFIPPLSELLLPEAPVFSLKIMA